MMYISACGNKGGERKWTMKFGGMTFAPFGDIRVPGVIFGGATAHADNIDYALEMPQRSVVNAASKGSGSRQTTLSR